MSKAEEAAREDWYNKNYECDKCEQTLDEDITVPVFLAGCKWMLDEAEKMAGSLINYNGEIKVVRLSDLKKLIGEQE